MRYRQTETESEFSFIQGDLSSSMTEKNNSNYRFFNFLNDVLLTSIQKHVLTTLEHKKNKQTEESGFFSYPIPS